jgi:hypothetical protein
MIPITGIVQIGFSFPKTLTKHLLMPFRYRYLPNIGGYSIPERLHILKFLVDRKIIETRWW